MPIAVSCRCGENYHLKDEYANQNVECPKCGDSILVGQSAVTPPSFPGRFASANADPVFGRDRYLMRQKHLSISEKYYVWDEGGRELLFIERPAHLLRNLLALLGGLAAGIVVATIFGFLASVFTVESLKIALGVMAALGFVSTALVVGIALSRKRDILFYSDDSRRLQLLEIKQDKKVAILNATYTLKDAGGLVIARFRKNLLFDLIRKRWHVYLPNGQLLCMAKEDSVIRSMLRRLLGSLYGLLRINFVILQGETDHVIGEFNRKFTILDRYVLDMTADPQGLVDRRIAVALGVLLDTGERR